MNASLRDEAKHYLIVVPHSGESLIYANSRANALSSSWLCCVAEYARLLRLASIGFEAMGYQRDQAPASKESRAAN